MAMGESLHCKFHPFRAIYKVHNSSMTVLPTKNGKRTRGLEEEETEEAVSHPVKPPSRWPSMLSSTRQEVAPPPVGSSEASVFPVEEVKNKNNLKDPPPSAPIATNATTTPTEAPAAASTTLKKPPQPSPSPPPLGSSEGSLAPCPVSVINIPNCAAPPEPTRHRVILSNVPSLMPCDGGVQTTTTTARGSMDAVYHGRTNRQNRLPPAITTTNPISLPLPLETNNPRTLLAALNAVAQNVAATANTMDPQARPEPRNAISCAPMAQAQLHPVQESESEVFVTAIPINVDPTTGAGEMSRQQRQESDLMERNIQRQLHRKRRQTIYGICMCLGLIVVLVGGILGAVLFERDSNSMSLTNGTTAPSKTYGPRLSYLIETLEPFMTTVEQDQQPWLDLIENPETPQCQTLQWLSEVDEYSSQPQDMDVKELVERYVLALVYFATSMSADNGISYLNTTSSVCHWNNRLVDSQDDIKGVFCSNSDEEANPDTLTLGALTYLDLHASNLIGTLPWEISLLEDLETLKLEDNDLTGTLSSELALMSSLKNLWLQSNSMNGTLPSNMPPSLEQLVLTNNQFSGTLASEWASSMPHLSYAQLASNPFGGTIPSEYGRFHQLVWLDLESTHISGIVPTQLGALTNMERLYLESNSLTGTLPTQLGNLAQLQYLYINGNRELTGTVPSEFSQLDQLESFLFHNTSLTGSVDSFFCILPEESFPSTMWADCLGEESEMGCTCCDVCCSAEGDDCRSNVEKSDDTDISLTPPTRLLRSHVSYWNKPSATLSVSSLKPVAPPLEVVPHEAR